MAKLMTNYQTRLSINKLNLNKKHMNTINIVWKDNINHYLMAKILINSFYIDKNIDVFVTERGIWPSCEDSYLWDCLGKCLFGKVPSGPKIGMRFSKSEISEVISVAHIALQFGWGGYFICHSAKFWFSHDGVGHLKVSQNTPNPFSGVAGIQWKEVAGSHS